MSLTEKIVDAMGGKVVEPEELKSIGDDVYLDYAKKSSLEDEQCFACGSGDTIPLDGFTYGITSAPSKEHPNGLQVTLCPRHMTDIAEQLLLHIWRVGKGKEKGGIKLPLLRWKGEDE